MSVRLDGEVIRLEGDCGVDDAEPLAAMLAQGSSAVDLSAAVSLHAAVAQALLAFGPEVRGPPADAFLAKFVAPALARGGILQGVKATRSGGLR